MKCRIVITVAVYLLAAAAPLHACPFCQLLDEKTIVDLIDENGAVTIARLTTPSMSGRDRVLLSLRNRGKAEAAPTASFEATEVLKGASAIAPGQKIDVPFPTQAKPGAPHLLCAPGPETLVWMAPVPLTPESLTFIESYRRLPRDDGKSTESSATRLAFFLPYLAHADPVLETAAYGEFAKAPYDAVTALKPLLSRDHVLEWLQNKDASVDRQRLYLVLLGICGTDADIPALAGWLKSEEKRNTIGTDALIACYLCLRGEDGMDTIDDLFLKGETLNHNDIFATVAALEFHSFQKNLIPKTRLRESFRLILNQPDTADLVIPDLAILEDWESIPRLIDLYKTHGKEFGWIKEPVILFLRTCPLPEAEAHLRELSKLDPDLVRNTEGAYHAEDVWGRGPPQPAADSPQP